MQPTSLTTEQIRALIAKGKLKDAIFKAMGIFCLAVALLVIVLLVSDMVAKGSERFTLDFFLNFASRRATQAGILSAWVGSLLVMLVTALAAVPLGVAAGVYLEEYAKRNWLTEIIRVNVGVRVRADVGVRVFAVRARARRHQGDQPDPNAKQPHAPSPTCPSSDTHRLPLSRRPADSGTSPDTGTRTIRGFCREFVNHAPNGGGDATISLPLGHPRRARHPAMARPG